MNTRSSCRTALCSFVAAMAITVPTSIAQAAPPSAPAPQLTPALRAASSSAFAAAREQGIPLWITSGARSWSQQQQLWTDGIATYGSPALARPWVLPPEESTHVRGEAIDVGPLAGAQWLEVHGYRWGLCRTFHNEWWHFEIATSAGSACPAPISDASQR